MRVLQGLLVGLAAALVAGSSAGKQKNVLLIYVDDLRMQINHLLESDFMVTPNLDAFLQSAVYARNGMVQQGVCSPSRTSLLTGRRPDTTGVFDLWKYFRNVTGPNWITLPQAFKESGKYDRVSGQGKIFHPGHASGQGYCPRCTGDDYPFSWTEPYFHAPSLKLEPWSDRLNASWLSVPASEHPESIFPDAQIVTNAIGQMTNYTNKGETWFVGAGLHKPHLPFVFPSHYLDLYKDVNVTEPFDPNPPKGMPEIAWSGWGELRAYADIARMNISKKIANVMPEWKTIELRRAYYAATSFTDFQIGRLLKAVDDLGQRDNTVVAMVGDHGWQLNDHAEWCKHTDFTIVTRAPLIIRDPDYEHIAGTEISDPVEHVDLFPTLLDLTGLEAPPGLEGMSLKPLMDNPGMPWKRAALSQYPRDGKGGPHKDESEPGVMGYTMFTAEGWKYTSWVKFNDSDWAKPFPYWDQVVGEELYDHREDVTGPLKLGHFDNINLASDPQYAQLKAQLHEQLKEGPWGQLPDWKRQEMKAAGMGPGRAMNIVPVEGEQGG